MKKVFISLFSLLIFFSAFVVKSSEKIPHRIGIMVASLPSEYWWYARNNMKLLESFLEQMKREGVQFVRFLLYYPVNPISQINLPHKGIYAPFKVNRKKKVFNLAVFEEKYWEGLRNTLLLLIRYRIVPVVSVLDYPEKHRELSRRRSFWFTNLQGVRGFRDRRFLKFARSLMRKTVEEVRKVMGDRWYLELGNEFSFAGSEKILRNLMKTVTVETKFPISRILVPFSPKYDGFQNLVFCSASRGLSQWKWKAIPAYHFSTIEDFSLDRQSPEWKWMMERFRVFFFSTDGFQGDKRDKKVLLKLFNAVFREVVQRGKKVIFFEEQPVWIWKGKEVNSFRLMHDLSLMPEGWIRSLRREMTRLLSQD